MRNDIDDILNSMFRGGKFRLGDKGEGPEKKGPASQEPDPMDLGAALEAARQRQEQAGQAVAAAQEAGDSLSKSLGESIQELTRQAKADMAGLELRLQADGVDHRAAAANQGSPQDLDSAFETARLEAVSRVLGQDGFVTGLTLALKRPFVAGSQPGAPLCRAAILGEAGTGRHSALEVLIASLGRQGVLKSPKTAALDLGAYSAAGSEQLFFQDLYAALKGGAAALVFEGVEKCCPAVLALVSGLFQEGSVPLPGRYAEQKGMLVDIGSALVPGAVSSLSGAGKYLFLLTSQSREQLAGTFGAPFLAALDDICETAPFSPEALGELADRCLRDLCEKSQKQLGFPLTYGPQEAAVLSQAFTQEAGAASLKEEAERLYKALSEVKLKQGLPAQGGRLAAGEAGMELRFETAGAETVLSLEHQAPQEDLALQAVKAELDEIVGLTAVKDYILSLEDNFKMQQLRKERGLKADSPSMHMIFTGNPGTGKTTVARIVSRYLKAIGALSGGQLVEVARADLVGQYVGHTAPLTQKAIQAALGGVLFIDEAYSLYRGKDDSFGLEAIDTLVKGMEDHRDELVVILAGYSREMEEFLTANSGLRSRFPHIIEFPDYTAQELLDITKSIVKGKGYRLDPGCDRPLLRYYEEQQRTGDPRVGGNGRMARNKVEEAVIACSRRNVNLPEEQQDLELLLPEDFGV